MFAHLHEDKIPRHTQLGFSLFEHSGTELHY